MADTAVERPEAVQQMLDPSNRLSYDFSFNAFLQREFEFGADPERPVCEAFRKGFCPNKPCPDKHHLKSNYTNMPCKHYLRGLCKKVDCEWLHEYNLREMPECFIYTRYGICLSGSECVYRHVDSIYTQPQCQHYMRGFCPLGPRCGARHERKGAICQFYINGFCPNGKGCPEGIHPKWKEEDEMEKPRVKVVLSEEQEAERVEYMKAQMQRDSDENAKEKRFLDRGMYNQLKMQGRGGNRRGFGGTRGGDRNDRY